MSTPSTHRSARTSIFLLMLVTVCACENDPDDLDAGRMDASMPDAQVVLDATEFFPDSGDVGPASDANYPSDVGADTPAERCPGACRPDEGSCRDLEACVLWTATPECVPFGGSLSVGSPCEETDQCMAGLACFAGDGGGVCGRVCCRADPTSCEGDDVCSGSGMLVDGTMTEFGSCGPSRTCSLLNPASCGEGEGCYLIEEGEADCRPAGSVGVGEACEGPSDCLPGLGCVGAFNKQCARNCRIGAPDACPPAEGECRAFADSPEGAGLCSGSAARRP